MLRPVVLLAEDDPVIALDVRWHLESMQMEVIDVTDLDQLTELCLKKSPKGLIMNVKSPTGWDGWAFGAQLQNTFRIPVFFITGAAESPVNKTFSFPVLNKPFTRVQLKDHLGHWFAVRGN